MMRRVLTVIGMLLGSWLAAPRAALAAEATPWPTVNLNYASDRFAAPAQITPQNAALLGEVCRVRVDTGGSFQSGLVLVDGLLYLTARNATVALDPADCSVAWKSVYAPEGPEPLPVVRGLAFADGRIFRGTTDCRLLALDAKTGSLLWKVPACDPTRGESLAAAPLAWNGTVFIGIAGGDFGVRGRMFATDAASGRELWRFDTVPAPGEFGASGKVRWRFHARAPVVSGITPTAGGVIFAGDMSGTVYALDSDDGRVVFKYDTGGAVAGGVITYRMGDMQYVAATSGNVSRLVWGETGLPSIVIFRLGGAANAAVASGTSAGLRMGASDTARGARLFSQNCAACHGGRGEGLTGPSLKGIGRRLSPPELSAWIMNPVARTDSAPAMPKLYPSALTEQDVFDAAAFAATL